MGAYLKSYKFIEDIIYLTLQNQVLIINLLLALIFLSIPLPPETHVLENDFLTENLSLCDAVVRLWSNL